MIAVGTQLGSYTLLAPLGAGGMGEVYRARDAKLDREVAVKVLPSRLADDQDALARFEREAKAVAALSHPNILAIFDFGRHGETSYAVMELLQGATLRERLSTGALPQRRALEYALQIVQGLAAAHGKGIIHRDLKPENLFVTDEGRLKILDFGLVKITPANRSLTQAQTMATTEPGTVLGTVGYMAPEQVRGQPADHRADLFSFGAILYEMLSGERAFRGETAVETLNAILKEEPRQLTETIGGLAPGLERLVDHCLEKNPEQRFQSARDVAFDLEALLGAPARAPLPLPGIRHQGRRPVALWGAMIAIALLAVLLANVGGLRDRLLVRPGREAPAPARPGDARSAVAVLPFQNLSTEGPQAYFASGLHDELLTQLAKVAALKVISRTSVMGYQGTSKPLRAIATELGVGSVVEGSVQVVGGRLRVNVQLIDAATDEHLWAERYDRTLDDAFAIQSEVAQQIVAAVGATLTSVERGRLTAAPTANAEAYRLYLQGHEYWTRPGYLRQDRETAQQLYERALGLDPSFALAHAALSQVHGLMYWFRYDPSAARAARQREEAEAALRLAPDLPQAHGAMGLAHYWGRRDYRRALDEFGLALKGLPNDAELWRLTGAVHRRLGNWNQFFAAFEKAAELNPRDAQLFHGAGGQTLRYLHRYADAVRAYDRALSLAPDLHVAAIERGWAYVAWQGRLDTLRAVLNRLPREAELGELGDVAAQRAALLLWGRNAADLLKMLEAARVDVFVGQGFYIPSALYAGWAHQLRGDHAAARAAFDSARVRLDSALSELPDDPRVHVARGLALAGLGRRAEALREASWLRQSVVYREDALDGADLAEGRARILAQAGDAEAALDEIERLLAAPSRVSVHTLRLDPRWDPIRDHPRFKALLAK